MSGFDSHPITFTEPYNHNEENEERIEASADRIIGEFKEFILNFQNMRSELIYRNQLKQNCNLKRYFLSVNVDDIRRYRESLGDALTAHPLKNLGLFEAAAKKVAEEILYPTATEDDVIPDIQITLNWSGLPTSIRQLKSEHVSKLVKIRGVAVSVGAPRVKAQVVSIQCRSCRIVIPNIVVKSGVEGITLPRKCPSNVSATQALNFKPQCPLDPFFVIPEKSRCTDAQVAKLQEPPESTPAGEMPRNLQLYMERHLCESIRPGDKITVIGVYSIKRNFKRGADPAGAKASDATGVRKPYIIVLGIEQDFNVANTSFNFSNNLASLDYTSEEIEQFHRLARSRNVYEIITKSVAPSIYGGEDIKKAIACLLFGGSSIKLPDGLTLRGDINVLLLGDPGTAKSQLLKFVEKAAPTCVYTSGKGSSAAGLTASINRDSNGGFVIEGGAMVLADGGVVCIDEFDKMREDDRVAIHEAMEQQTISIAKAGITTTLNSRCAVLAAANSVFGRWDDLKGGDNINFLPSILSRFDMIFIVKDEHGEDKDMRMAKHILKIHMMTNGGNKADEEGELSIEFLKKYIDFCRKTCGPRLSGSAAERLRLHYVKVRGNARAQEKTVGKRSPIVITVRQLEAISRIAESLAKMRLAPFVSEEDVDEAIRLFHISTWDAANRGGLNGAEGFTGLADLEEIRKIESQLKQRFAVGTQVSYQRVVEDLIQQVFLF